MKDSLLSVTIEEAINKMQKILVALFVLVCRPWLASLNTIKEVSETESSIICVTNYFDGKPRRSFKGVKDMEEMEYPCYENGISYCQSVSMSEIDLERCSKTCCAQKEPTTSTKEETKARPTRWPRPLLRTTTKTEEINAKKSKNSMKNQIDSTSNDKWYYIVVISLVAVLSLIIFGVCKFKDRKVIKRQQADIVNLMREVEQRPGNVESQQPLICQPIDGVDVQETMETAL